MLQAYINAKIRNTKDTAFLVRDSYIIQTGSDEKILQEVTDEDEVIDLAGAFVTPGFADTHMHLLGYGMYLDSIRLDDARSIEDIQTKVRRHVNDPERTWITAYGYNEDRFTQPERPTKQMLDDISRDKPIVLMRSCGHVMTVNSKALELAGITEDTEIPGGAVDYEHGILEENAMTMITALSEDPDRNTLRRWAVKAMKQLNRCGITMVGSDDFIALGRDWKTVTDILMQMSYRDELTVRISEQCEFNTPEDLAEFLDEGYTTGVGDDMFRIGPLKMIADGSLGAGTAALRDGYLDDPENHGILIHDDDTLDTFIGLANRYNMPAITHAIGDEALDQVLRVYEEYVLPGNPLHYGIVHCQIMREDQIEKVKKMHLDAYFQSLFIEDDASILKTKVIPETANTSYPFASLYHSVLAGNGSDAPVTEPDVMKSIALAVSRRSSAGVYLRPEEALTVSEALSSWCENGVRMLGWEEETGAIEAGRLADFAVLDQDIEQLPPEEIVKRKVLMTVVGGKVVYGG